MSTAITKTEEKSVEFVPYGASDKVKLTVAMVKNLIAVKTKSGKTCSDAEAIKFVAMCQARRLNPFEGDAFLIGYDGKDGPTFSLITAHQAFLKRAELNPEYDGMRSGIILERDGQVTDVEGDFYMAGDKVLGGWATVFFKNRKQPMHKRVRMERFRKAFGVWVDDAAGMICKCAEADALRSSFPTMLGGLYLQAEVERSEVKPVSAPIFESRQVGELQPEPIVTTDAPAEEPRPKEDSAPTEEAKGALIAVRSLAKKAGIAETKLLDHLIGLGAISDGAASLEQALLENETCLQMLVERWSEMKAEILGK